MAFVNERISSENIEKYKIKEFDDKNYKGHYKPQWTVDHERDIYLRYLYSDREEYCNRDTYVLYWHGEFVFVKVEIDGGGIREKAAWRRYKLLKLTLPEALKGYETEVLADLKEAFIVYKNLGISSDVSDENFTATFDF